MVSQETLLSSIVRIHSYGTYVNFTQPFQREDRKKGVGTGTFVQPPRNSPHAQHAALYVLTCAHVVQNADTVAVLLPMVSQTDEIDAQVLSFVPEYDLAIIIIPDPQHKYRQLTHVLQLGQSDGMRLRTKLTAFGFPMGQTALKASEGVYAGYQRLLQHTVSISPGNSGGPLVNEENRIIGVNNSGMVAATASDIFYAVPIEFYVTQQDRLFSLQPGPPAPTRVLRLPSYGLCYQEATVAQLRASGIPSGVFVYKVLPESPASQALLQHGCMLTHFNGAAVERTGEVAVKWNYQKVPLTDVLFRCADSSRQYMVQHIMQSGECLSNPVTPKDIDINGMKELFPPFDVVDYVAFAGLCIMQVCKNHVKNPITMAAYVFQEPEELMRPQCIITHIFAGSQAQVLEAVHKGEVLTHVNNVPVYTLADVRAALLQPAHGDLVQFTVKRGETLALAIEDVLQEEEKNKSSNLYKIETDILNALQKLSDVKEKDLL